MAAILAKKLGMTQLFQEDGSVARVTVLEAGPCPVTAVRTADADGYDAVQLAFGAIKEKNLSKAERGHLAKADAPALRHVREFRGETGVGLGDTLTVDQFEIGDTLKVAGTSKGKGFQGTMVRHNFKGQRQTHGSMMHRRTGAIGCRSTPGRVWPGQKMPGQLGNDRRTVQNLKVVKKRPEDNVILVSGAVPGAKGGYVIIRPSKKKAGK